MAAELEDGLGLNGLDIRYIDQQLSTKALTPDLEELVERHRAYGVELRASRLQCLGDFPATPDEQEQWTLKKQEIEEQVSVELASIRQQTPGLDEAWLLWCEREKLVHVRENLVSQHHSQPCLVQAVPPEYAHLSPPLDPNAGMEGPMTSLMQQGPSIKVDPSGMLAAGLDTGHQHVQAWENGLHVTPLGNGPLGWDGGQQMMQPQQLHHHHVHPHAMHSQLPLKLCRRCNVQKPVSQFYKSKANSDGYDGRCKTCDAVQCAERRKRKQRVEAPTVSWKTCRRCNMDKPSTDFYRNKTNPDGLYNNCKACFAADATARRERMAPLEERTVPTKQCKRCKISKPSADFYKNKLMSDGLYSHCKECYSQAATERANGRTPAESKECRRCKETKPASDFYNSKMTADGLQSYCKQCYAVAASQRRTKLQEQQGMPGLPTDVAMGMEEQMAFGGPHMDGTMGGHMNKPVLDSQLMGHPQMMQPGQQLMTAQMGTGAPQMNGAAPQMGQSPMGQQQMSAQQMGQPQMATQMGQAPMGPPQLGTQQMGQPQLATQMGQPQLAAQMGQPQMGTQMGQPQMGTQMGQPQMGTQMGQPQMGTQMGQPQMGTQMGQPQMGTQMGQPQMGTQMGQPQMGTQMGQPQMGTQMGQPQMGTQMGQPQMAPKMGQPQMPGQHMAPHHLAMPQLAPGMVPAMGMIHHVNPNGVTTTMISQVPQQVHQPMQHQHPHAHQLQQTQLGHQYPPPLSHPMPQQMINPGSMGPQMGSHLAGQSMV